MHSVQATMWDPRPPSKHGSPLPGPPPSSSRLTHVSTATPAKRITFYKSGDSQFGGIRMAIHKRSFKCFDALLDDLSQKVPLPFGVRTVTTPRGTHTIKHLEQLQDGGCYLCSDRRQAKPINMELASKRPSIWYHHSRRPQRPETSSATPPGHLPYRQRRILLVRNSEPGMRRNVVLSRRSTRNLRAFLDEVSEVMQFHVRKLYTTEGRRIDSVQSLMTCPGVLVCVGREAFSPMLVNFIRKSSEEKLPDLGSRSPGLGPRTPGNGARSPATQGARSPPHGAHSRASEYSEGHESKKNVNFGLETKKSIIHPRSDSSNRSTRFSLSSEKSYGNGVSAYSQARPAVMNDDIEKRVLVNKDGSLSVEMRVRFRLHSDETLQWSTQIKKSPSLINDCYPLNQAEPHYLQKGQSESCSDPDSMSFDPEHVDYSIQPRQHALDVNHCPCCYQRQALQYDLWENSTHGHKQPPVPPPHPQTSGHTHSVMRHTQSSSSSSSCNSRRVVRCRAQLSSCRGGSGSEQSQVVQEEMCMTEQVEHRVDVEQDGDTHVEVCRVSQSCSHTEVVAMDSNLRPLSRKSVEDELEEDERPVSAISSSSHVLQSLKEDQDDEDDDLPPSASQCCHCSEPSPSPTFQTHLNDLPRSKVSAGSVYSNEHKTHGDEETRGSRAVSATSAVTPHSTAGADEINRASSTKSKMSRASGMSNKSKVPNSEEEVVADDEDEEVQRVVSGLSGHTRLSAGSQKSEAFSVCPVCGGCKRGVSSVSNSRASQKSSGSHQASSNPASLLPNPENKKTGDDDDSDDSAVSTQSNKTNLTNHGCLTNGLEGRESCAMSRISNPEPAENEDDRAPSAISATSHRSKISHKSGCNGTTGVTAEKEEERSSSNMSAQSNLSAKSSKSHKSNCSGSAAAPDIRTREEAEGEDAAERAISSLSVKSGVSAKTNDSVKSHKSYCPLSSKIASPTDNMAIEEQCYTNKRAPSSLSVKSDKAQRPDSALSANSNVTAKSTCSHCAMAASPAAKVAVNKETGQEEGTEVEERAVSVMSAKSNLSVKSNKSYKSTKASGRSLSPRSEAEIDGVERAASQMSARSVKSVKSCKSNCNGNETVVSPSLEVAGDTEEKQNEVVEVETQQRPESVTSAKSEKEERPASAGSSKCNGNTRAVSESGDNTGDSDEPKDRAASALSCKSASSANSHHTKPEMDVLLDRTPSAMSVKSHTSATSSKSQKSNHTAASPDPNEAAVLSIASATSVKSKSSARSSASVKNSRKTLESLSPSHNVVTIKTPEGSDEDGNETIERTPSAASAKSERSNVSSALSHKSNHKGTADVAADADVKVVKDSEDSPGQMLLPKGIDSPQTDSPIVRSAQSPVQQLLPGGKTRGPSVLSVHSTTSAKSGRAKCRCGAASAKKAKEGEDKEVVNEEENEEEQEQGSERAASIMSSSSRRGTEQPLSRNSSESVSLGLPEDKDTAESDSGKSSVSFHTNTENRCRARAPDFPQSPEESAVKKDLERTGSTMSQKSNNNHGKSSLSQNPPAVDIPTIETPGEGEDDVKDGEQKTKRTDSAVSTKSSKAHKSSCKCRVKAAAQTEQSKSKKKEKHAIASPTKAESVKSASTSKASYLDTPDNRTSSVMSSGGAKVQNKTPASVSPTNVNVVTTNAGDSTNHGTENQTAGSPDCGLRPESAASAQLKQSAGESSVTSDHLNPVKGHKSRSNAGSDSGSVKTSNSQKKETPLRPHSKVETCSASTMSPCLSAAELLKETMAAARPRSCQSKASKTSHKPRSENSARCKRSRKQEDQEELELTPAFLPYTSPSEVVSDWLRSIPANSSMLELGDELNECEQEKELEEKPGEEVAKEEEIAEVDTLDKEEKTEVQEEEEKEGEVKCDGAEEERSSDQAPGDAVAASCPNTLLMTSESMPRNWHSSAAVMKVLLSSSLGRCQSMPEVSPVYGRRLSTSARGLLDCLAQLQLIEPAVSPGCDQNKDRNQQYDNIMAILQSLWLTEPKEVEAMEAKGDGTEQVTPPRSSSGVDMSSGSGGSGKENGNQGEGEAPAKETESLHEDEEAEKAVEEEEEGNAEVGDREIKVEPEERFTEQATTDIVEEPVQSEEQSTVPPSLDSPKATENPSSLDKCSAKDSSKSPTDNEQETLEDSSSCTPPTVLRAPLTKRFSQDPDPVWVLHLLRKLEKQFMSHYVNAMAEFKVRWDLDDNLILNTMITELKDEVSRRIQSSIEREMRKIHCRAGKGGRSPRPPQEGNLSRESTMTEKRRRMLKVMKNQSVKTADSLSDEEMMGDYSDQRSDDEYCPCDACVRKKMAARPFKTNPMAAEAPLMTEFDLLKILQLKKSPLPAAVPQPVSVEGEEEEEKNLEVVQEEEEEDETKEDIKADVVLEETIAEEDEEIGQKEDGGEEGEEEEVEAENEGNSVGDEVQEEREECGEGRGEDKASENGEQEEEEGEAECQCHSARNDEGGDKTEEEEGETEGQEAEETSNNTGEDETADDEERAEEEELESTEDDGEAGDNEAETGTGEEESDKETVKGATGGEGETTENGEGEVEEEESAEDDGEAGDNEAETGTGEEESDKETVKGATGSEGETTENGDGEEEEEESAEDDGEAGDNEAETGTGEEESDKETVKEATGGEGETTENGDGEEEVEELGEQEEVEEEDTTGRESEEVEVSGEPEDDSTAKQATNEESTMVEEFAEGNVSASAEAEDEDDGDEGESHEDEKGGETGEQEGEASEEERASPTQGQGLTPAVCVTEGEEADAEDSDTDTKRRSETSADESGREADGTTGDEEQQEEGGRGDEEDVAEDAVEEFKPEDEEEVNSNTREDGALLHQFTRTSVESQPGSLEEIDTDSPQNSIEAPEMAAGVSTGGSRGQGTSQSPGKIKRHKPKDSG